MPEEEAPPDDLVKYDLLLDEWLDMKDCAEKRKDKKPGNESFRMY